MLAHILYDKSASFKKEIGNEGGRLTEFFAACRERSKGVLNLQMCPEILGVVTLTGDFKLVL